MSCMKAVFNEENGWECDVTGDGCVFVMPNSKKCAELYQEGPDVTKPFAQIKNKNKLFLFIFSMSDEEIYKVLTNLILEQEKPFTKHIISEKISDIFININMRYFDIENKVLYDLKKQGLINKKDFDTYEVNKTALYSIKWY